jgi:hypothetical protein
MVPEPPEPVALPEPVVLPTPVVLPAPVALPEPPPGVGLALGEQLETANKRSPPNKPPRSRCSDNLFMSRRVASFAPNAPVLLQED